MEKEVLSGLFKLGAALLGAVATFFLPKLYKWFKSKRTIKIINDEFTLPKSLIGKRSDDGVFVGRGDEIRTLKKLIREFNLIVIKGYPGIGKTTLVRNLLLEESIKKQFGGNLIFVELSEQFTPDGVCNKVLEKFGKSVRESDLSPSLQVFQELKQYEDYLIVFDNCEQIPEDVFELTIKYWAENFQNSKNFTFIVTSRKDHKVGRKLMLKALGLPKKATDVKSETTSAIIQKMKIHKPDFRLKDSDLDKLYNVAIKTGGVPWLIQIVAGKINYMSLKDIEVSVRDIKAGNRKKFFNKSYNEISKNAQYVFDQLSIFEDGFTYEAYESVVEMIPGSEETHREVIEDLISYSFIYYDRDLLRYNMLVHVKEIGELILEKWPKNELNALAIRWINYYYNLIQNKSALLFNVDTSVINEALDIMSSEKENVFASQKWLNKLRDYDKLTAISILFDEVLYSRGPATLRIDKLRYAYDNVKDHDVNLTVSLSIALSKANWSSGYWVKAEGFAKKAESIAEPGSVVHAKGLQQLGRILKDRGFLVESKRLLSEAKDIYVSKGVTDVRDLDDLNAELGNTYDQLGLFEKCIDTIGDTTGIPKSVSLANKYNRIALANWHHGRVEEAIKNVDVAISICNDINHKARAAAYTTNKALIQIDIGDYDSARITFQKNFDDHKNSGHRHWLAVNHGGLGRLYLRRNNKKFDDIESAETQLGNALELSRTVGYSENIAWHLGDMGRLKILKQNYTEAINYVSEAIKFQRQMGAINSLRHFSNHISILRSISLSGESYDKLLEYDSLFNSLTIYHEKIKAIIVKPEAYLANDILFLENYLKKRYSIIIEEVRDKIKEIIPDKIYNSLKQSRDNEVIGAFEYHSDKKFKWKYLKLEFPNLNSINVFAYGILRNQEIRKKLNLDDNVEMVTGLGVVKKLNHLVEPDSYLGYGDKYPNGFLAYNIEYTGKITDQESGVLISLPIETLNSLGRNLKGFALRPITIEKKDGTIDFGFTFTSTNRVYRSRIVTTDTGPKNDEYLKNSEF